MASEKNTHHFMYNHPYQTSIIAVLRKDDYIEKPRHPWCHIGYHGIYETAGNIAGQSQEFRNRIQCIRTVFVRQQLSLQVSLAQFPYLRMCSSCVPNRDDNMLPPSLYRHYSVSLVVCSNPTPYLCHLASLLYYCLSAILHF